MEVANVHVLTPSRVSLEWTRQTVRLVALIIVVADSVALTFGVPTSVRVPMTRARSDILNEDVMFPTGGMSELFIPFAIIR